jgi:hypothetical protein
MTPILSFSACLAENPGDLKIENPEFSARNARSYPYPARLAPLHKIAPIPLFAQGDQAYCADFTFDRRSKRLKAKPVRGMRLSIKGPRDHNPGLSLFFETIQALSCRGRFLENVSCNRKP